MKELRMGELEERFANIIWENEPIYSGELSKLAFEALNWKKTTAFTVLHKLCEKGIVQNNHGTVTSILSKDEYKARRSEQFVEKTFNGSLPAFVAAFTTKKQLSKEEIAELRRMVDEFEGK
ncbi:MAG: BlaI/MecI/CopY family transcriptional regulator [Clostridia bacterium]|nr:BlaI/MecI/CopY family transcriptional regulator [Clostridia bacterium]MBR6006749.1 BlaI/MecI/CopY family transcriptional regulator [Clostridia bacterium]